MKLWLAIAAFAATTGTGPLTATLESTDGAQVELGKLWGKPTVVFYEDKDSILENRALKNALFAQGKQGVLQPGRVTVIGVANVRGLHWFPAQPFAVKKVKGNEKSWGVPIYLDWNGALSRPPWNLNPKGSAVLLIDPQGKVLFSKSGALNAEETHRFLSLLSGMVGG